MTVLTQAAPAPQFGFAPEEIVTKTLTKQ